MLWLPPLHSPLALSLLLALPTVCQTVLPLSLLTGFATSHRVIYALITSAFKCRAKKSSLCKNNFCGGVGKPARHRARQAKVPSQRRCRESGAEGHFLPHPHLGPKAGGKPLGPWAGKSHLEKEHRVCVACVPCTSLSIPRLSSLQELEADVHLGGRGGGQGCVSGLLVGKSVLC